MFDLTGKVAIVTGGAGGLGRPISLGLAKCGADVVVDDLASANPQGVADDITALGRKALAVTADVTSAESMKEMVDLVVKEFGKIDILVNVAGINARFSAEEMPPEEFEKVIRFNIAGTFLPCQAVGRVMIEQKRGKIINMGSVRGSVAPSIGGTAYASSKGGVHQLTRTLAAEWAKYGINVNGIAPALVMTAMTKDFLSQARDLLQDDGGDPTGPSGLSGRPDRPHRAARFGRVRLHDRADHLRGRRTVRRLIDTRHGDGHRERKGVIRP